MGFSQCHQNRIGVKLSNRLGRQPVLKGGGAMATTSAARELYYWRYRLYRLKRRTARGVLLQCLLAIAGSKLVRAVEESVALIDYSAETFEMAAAVTRQVAEVFQAIRAAMAPERGNDDGVLCAM